MLEYFSNLWTNSRTARGDTIRELLQNNPEVRPFPAAVTKLISVVQDANSSVAECANIIQCDAALATRLLRIANSPVYGFKHQVTSIAHAASVLGQRGLRTLAMSAAAAAMFSQGESANEQRKRIWQQSLGAGVVAKSLAEIYPRIDGDEAFLACVFHDVGRVYLFDQFPDEYTTISDAHRGIDLVEKENEVFGWNHQEIGLISARTWNLSENVQMAIGFHHTPDQAVQHPEFVSLIHISIDLANYWGLGVEESPEVAYPESVHSRNELDELTLANVQTIAQETIAETFAACM